MSSTAGTEFQKRLGAAIQQRGLSLARIRDRLGQQGMAVSIATLSYWTSGRSRPTRASSLEIVRALEILLGTEPGWLVAEIPGPSHAHPLSDVMQRKELLAAAVEEHGLRTSADWRTLSVRHSACIDAAGCERRSENWALMQAVSPRATGYTAVVEGHADSVQARGLGMVHAERTIQVAEDLFIVEFVLDTPVSRGDRVLVGDRIDLFGTRRSTFGVAYALKANAQELVLEATFAGEMPATFSVTSQLPERDDPVIRAEKPLVGGHNVQVVLTDPGAGLHSITWD